MKKTTREWIRKAENDSRLAAKLARGKEAFHDELCFHCQQSAEKYLKALLNEAGIAIPRTHHLDDLLNLLVPNHPPLRRFRRGLIFLSDFAVVYRYPGENATKRQALAAHRWCRHIRLACRGLLGIRPTGRGGKSK